MITTRTRYLLASLIAAGALFAGCTSDNGQPTSADDPPTTEPKAEEPAEPKETEAPVEPELSERGNAIKKIGELAGSTEDDGDTIEDAWLKFKVTDISVGECTEEYATPAENGNIILVDISASTGSEWPTDMQGTTVDFGYEWSVVGKDGLTESALDTMATLGCIPDSELMPMNGMGPGEKVTGTVVLDSRHTHGTVVFKPWWLLDGGWEWTF